jgi:hypothetical protein
MPSRGPALTFDPHYVTAVIDTWRTRNLVDITPIDLERRTAHLMRERFLAWNSMGMREQPVSMAAVTKAINLLIALKLAKKTAKGKGETRVAILTTTPAGRTILAEEPISGTLYPSFAECFTAVSEDTADLLSFLAEHGPITQPILQLVPEAPRRGTAYQLSIQEGLVEFRHQLGSAIVEPIVSYEPVSPKATPPQRIKAAQTWAIQAHPAGKLKQLDKAIAVGLAFGLLWVDVPQINEVIGARSVGLAATQMGKGYRPNILSWPADSNTFVRALVNAISTRANGSGFATIQEVRGAIGRRLSLSPIAVDALLREARDAGDRHEISVELHFEPDEDQLYAVQRDPLIWRDEAFEFVTVLQQSSV